MFFPMTKNNRTHSHSVQTFQYKQTLSESKVENSS